jgi:Uma2 family endonuclease
MEEEWMENGCKLAWLINPKTQKMYIFRENKEVEIVVGFDKKLSGENVLVGFELDLSILK